MFRIAICDDEVFICSEIEQIIMNYRECSLENIDIEVFCSGEELCNYMYMGEKFDLIILDIVMQKLNGVDTARYIRDILKDEQVQIIFISWRESYYKELFDVRPMHFLSKPVDSCRLIKDIEKAIELAGRTEYSFCFKQGTVIHKMALKDILYFEANGRKVRMVTKNGVFYFYGNLCKLYSDLETYHFILIHQSYLVNFAHVIEFGYNELKLTNAEYLPISRQRRKQVSEITMKYNLFKK
jgi:DNA-binding LytR/AlgR family response regulator